MITSIANVSRALAEKKISCVELTEHFLTQIKSKDDKMNALLHTDEELTLAQAREADALRSNGDQRPFLGIPIIHKDIFVTKDMPTTCGSKILKDYMSPYNATIVDKFHQSGMTLLGKANMDEFAMGSSNETSHYGPARNPWHHDYVPGGSSGGSAAAVAAGYSLVATASDTGGSIRQPASVCGVTGIKPSYGRVSRYGMIAFSSSLDQGGVITKTAEDAALMLNIIQGQDYHDASTAKMPTEDFTRDLSVSVKGLKIGLPKQFFQSDLDPGIRTVIDEAIELYKGLGASFVSIDLPSLKYSIPTYYIIQPAEASSNLARYDGIRYGYRCGDANNLQELFMNSRHDGFGLEVKRRILMGTFALSSGHQDEFYKKALHARTHICNDFNKAFAEVDVILGPTCPRSSFKIGQLSDDPILMYLSDIFTIGVNMAGLPGMSIPAGFHHEFPVGLQLITNKFKESLLLRTAHQFQLHSQWHLATPKFLGY